MTEYLAAAAAAFAAEIEQLLREVLGLPVSLGTAPSPDGMRVAIVRSDPNSALNIGHFDLPLGGIRGTTLKFRLVLRLGFRGAARDHPQPAIEALRSLDYRVKGPSRR